MKVKNNLSLPLHLSNIPYTQPTLNHNYYSWYLLRAPTLNMGTLTPANLWTQRLRYGAPTLVPPWSHLGARLRATVFPCFVQVQVAALNTMMWIYEPKITCRTTFLCYVFTIFVSICIKVCGFVSE